jgi:hypothetical protein
LSGLPKFAVCTRTAETVFLDSRNWYKFDCITYDCHFSSNIARVQYLQDFPIHALSFEYETCNRSFGSKEALEQYFRDLPVYLRDLPVHALSFEYKTCNRSFGSKKALEQHVRDLTVHAPAAISLCILGNQEIQVYLKYSCIV